MKKQNILRLLALLCCAAMLVSCQNPNQPDTSESDTETVELAPSTPPDTRISDYVLTGGMLQYTDGNLYFHHGDWSNFTMHNAAGTMIRRSTEDGSMAFVCQTPACDHTTNKCPFAGAIVQMFTAENKLIYTRYIYRDEAVVRQFCTYDLVTAALTVHREEIDPASHGLSNRILFHNGCWYYHEKVYDDAAGSYKWAICRLAMDTGVMTVIGTNTENYITRIGIHDVYKEQLLFVLNDRLYFSDVDTIYSTDLDLGNKTVHLEGEFLTKEIYTDGTYLYYGDPDRTDDSADNGKLHLHRYHLTTGEHLDLGITTDTNGWYLTRDYLYYKNYAVKEFPSTQEEENYISLKLYSDALYRCRHDGTEKEMVFDLYQEDGEQSTYFDLIYPVVVGDTLYSLYSVWGEDTYKGYCNREECYLLQVDLNDGTWESIRIRSKSGK